MTYYQQRFHSVVYTYQYKFRSVTYYQQKFHSVVYNYQYKFRSVTYESMINRNFALWCISVGCHIACVCRSCFARR